MRRGFPKAPRAEGEQASGEKAGCNTTRPCANQPEHGQTGHGIRRQHRYVVRKDRIPCRRINWGEYGQVAEEVLGKGEDHWRGVERIGGEELQRIVRKCVAVPRHDPRIQRIICMHLGAAEAIEPVSIEDSFGGVTRKGPQKVCAESSKKRESAKQREKRSAHRPAFGASAPMVAVPCCWELDGETFGRHHVNS